MPRALFEKTGSAIYLSHLDLMRLFQRAFKRAGLPLTHTQGFNPRPSVSIALPLSLGVESRCELLDFALETDEFSPEQIRDRLNAALVEGVRVLSVYDSGRKIRELCYLDCALTLEYDAGVPAKAAERIDALFSQENVTVEKKGKNGVTEQNIIPMIRSLTVSEDADSLELHARVCCQNPTLNPVLLGTAIIKYLPELTPDFIRCRRVEIYDTKETIFR
ncbi:MAG: TIGR03936 family radical SAM-associated protein [Firmicutes bacterium]|nr:TIGR03936 family radical SAM-associated protein [Bacillota bacterium]